MKRFNTIILYILIIFTQFACQILKKPSNGANSPGKVIRETATKPTAESVISPPVPSEVVLSPPAEQTRPEPIAMTVGSNSVKTLDLQLQLEKMMVDDSITPQKALDQAIYDQRILAEAKRRGYDKDEDFKGEVETYRDILSEAYLTDSTTIKFLLKETYDWMQQEVRAAHIMYQISEFANPADTAAIYQKLLDIRGRAVAGEDFGALAQQFSQDKKTSSKGGDLGWFTALQLVYPLEKAAFSVPVGQVSMPVKSKGGYHILKVIERRPNSGKVLVQHILKTSPPNDTTALNSKAKARIDSIYVLLTKGESFENLSKKYSDDYKTKNFGGFLPTFGIGTREETAFEQAAFALKEGQFSKPVRTSAGWHIIKLSQKQPLESYESILPKLKEKVVTDSRGDVVKENALKRLKSEAQFVENDEVIKQAIALADTNLLRKKWTYSPTSEVVNKPIFTIGKNEVKTKAFYDFAVDRQGFERVPAGFTPPMVMRSYYKKFVENTIKRYVEQYLESINPEFRLLLNEYSTSLLKMQLLNDLVYEKSTSDTIAQRQFFDKNRDKYRMPERTLATVIASKEAKTVYQVKDIFTKGAPYQLNSAMRNPLYYEKNMNDLTPDHKKVLASLLEIMRRNKGYVVEVAGYADQNEGVANSADRVEKVKNFLVTNGLPIERIIENDYGKTKPADRFDWTKNQRVTFQFYSNSKKDVEKRFNRKEPNKVNIDEGYFKRGDNKYTDAARWEVGTHSITKDGRFADVIVEKIEPARYKTLKEARGQVISDYQKELEKKFNEELIARYPVTLNKEEVQKVLEMSH